MIVIVLSGAAVRLTGSGLGCPDWPTCFKGRITGSWSICLLYTSTAQPGLEGAAGHRVDVALEFLQRRRLDDDEYRDPQQRGSFDDQGLSLAKTFERTRRLRRATKAGRARRDVITSDAMDRPGRETMRSDAAHDIDMNDDVQRRRRELQTLEQRVPIRHGTEVANPQHTGCLLYTSRCV